MSAEREEFVLGADVTRAARSRRKAETVVLSLRLSLADLRRLEQVGAAQGKSVSQVAREAIKQYLQTVSEQGPTVVLALAGGGFVRWGSMEGTAAQPSTSTVEVR